MLFKLFLLFTLVPIVELALLIELGSHIGSLTTVVLVVITGVAGAALARNQGLLVFQRLRSSIGQGQSPGDALIDGVLIVAGGLLLLTPGILTDGLGFSALLPPSQQLIRSALKVAISRRINRQTINTHFTVS